ncbi:MAG: LysR substrate-binding domain-containing protein [Paracoccaceae bacterium]|jgi:DNA-binding transcriptional LysR family regulator
MIPNLSIRQLQTFREIMRSGSVSAASRVLGRSQPSVSAMLANLEAELGFDLFERRKGRLIPKPEAHFFFEETQEILDRINRSAQTMREIGNLDRGQLKIASLPGASLFFLPQMLADFIKDKPEVKASIMTRSSVKIHEWIASQQYDIGLAEVPKQQSALNIRPINLECVCALRKDDPLAEKPYLTPDDLDNAPMAALYPEHFTHQNARRVFEESGKRFNIRFEMTIFIPAMTLVEQGYAYSLVDQISAASYYHYSGKDTRLTFRPFRPLLPFNIAVLTPAHRPLSRLAAAFCDRIENDVKRFVELV